MWTMIEFAEFRVTDVNHLSTSGIDVLMSYTRRSPVLTTSHETILMMFGNAPVNKLSRNAGIALRFFNNLAQS
jgi:hypothetical protein